MRKVKVFDSDEPEGYRYEEYPEPLQLKVKRLTKTAKLPTKAHDTDACFDVSVDLESCPFELETLGTKSVVRIRPGHTRVMGTGISVQSPPGYHVEVRPRSGLSMHGLTVINSPGTVDRGYTGELKILLGVISTTTFEFAQGDKIAQIRLERDWDTEIVEVDELEEMDRGDNGFGSTGP